MKGDDRGLVGLEMDGWVPAVKRQRLTRGYKTHPPSRRPEPSPRSIPSFTIASPAVASIAARDALFLADDVFVFLIFRSKGIYKGIM